MKSDNKLLGDDYRLFSGTPVWEIAKSIEENDTVRLIKLLEKDKKNINHQEQRFGQTLLLWSVYAEKFDGFKILLRYGANINIETYDSVTAIIWAAGIRESPQFLKLLIDAGADVNYEVKNDKVPRLRTPLIVAAFASLENTKLLVENGADVNYKYKNDEICESPLSSAFSSGNIDIIKYLIVDCEADVISPVYEVKSAEDEVRLFVGDLLRKEIYDLNSDDYKTKLIVIDYLKKKGIDYYSYPIPEHFYKQYSKEFLEKY